MEEVEERMAEKDYSIGLYYLGRGYPDAARRYWESLQKQYPGTRWARKAEESLPSLPSQE